MLILLSVGWCGLSVLIRWPVIESMCLSLVGLPLRPRTASVSMLA